MAIQSPPSLQHRHALVWSGDPALATPPDGADEATQKAWEARLRVARETGKWDDVLRPGELPTWFYVQPIRGTTLRLLADDATSGRIGPASMWSLCFRLGIKAIENPAIAFTQESDARLGPIAPSSVVDDLDALNPGIVAELGAALFNRAGVPPGK